MQLDIHQLDRKYEGVKVRDRREEARLRVSLEQEGQKQPVVVVRIEDDRYVLVDGYRRLRVLEKMGRDVVDALVLDTGEVEALVTMHHLQRPRDRSPLEDGYLVRVLTEEHGLSQRDIARRLGHTQSWVSRRLGLVRDLPEWLQALVRKGELTCKAATRALLPMARAIDGPGHQTGRRSPGPQPPGPVSIDPTSRGAVRGMAIRRRQVPPTGRGKPAAGSSIA